MAILKAPAGVALTTAMKTIVQNPSGSGMVWLVGLSFVNVDGVNDASISNCNMLDANTSNAVNPILPVNTLCKKVDGVYRQKVLEPGDLIQANASADGDIFVSVEVLVQEAV